jgi:hypothetical protein
VEPPVDPPVEPPVEPPVLPPVEPPVPPPVPPSPGVVSGATVMVFVPVPEFPAPSEPVAATT